MSDAFERFPVTYQPGLTAQQRAAVLSLAEKHELTAYGGAYLELASDWIWRWRRRMIRSSRRRKQRA